MLNLLNNVLGVAVIVGGLALLIKDELCKDVVKLFKRRRKEIVTKHKRVTNEELQDKLERKRREFEEFKEYIENCPQPEDMEVAENLNIEFDWDNISFIERMTVDDIVMNVNNKLLENGCRVDYRNIALHTLRNPFPSFN